MAIAAFSLPACTGGVPARQNPSSEETPRLPGMGPAVPAASLAPQWQMAGPELDDDASGPDGAPCYPIIRALMAGVAGTPPDCARLALDAAAVLGRADPVSSVQASRLQSFDGALYRTGTGAWTILYSDRLAAPDVRFMIAYLLGRQLLGGRGLEFVECSNAALMAMPDDDSPGGRGYAFASRLLMPIDACRRALPGAVDLDVLAALAGRFRLPVLHVARRWLSYTSRRAMLTLRRDGREMGCWASETAFGLRAGDLVDGPGARIALQSQTLAGGIRIELSVAARQLATRAGMHRRTAFPV